MKYILFVLLSAVGTNLLAMVAEPTRVLLWRKAETIGGEEFLPANESIVDYLNTLPRPTGLLEKFRYACQVKSYNISPSVYQSGTPSTTNTSWTNVRIVYELRNCVREN